MIDDAACSRTLDSSLNNIGSFREGSRLRPGPTNTQGMRWPSAKADYGAGIQFDAAAGLPPNGPDARGTDP